MKADLLLQSCIIHRIYVYHNLSLSLSLCVGLLTNWRRRGRGWSVARGRRSTTSTSTEATPTTLLRLVAWGRRRGWCIATFSSTFSRAAASVGGSRGSRGLGPGYFQLSVGFLDATVLLYKVVDEGGGVFVLELLVAHSDVVQELLPLRVDVATLQRQGGGRERWCYNKSTNS